jgi:hypothetical protein
MKALPTSRRVIVLGIALVSSGILVVFAVLALFASPSADDFCYAVKARDLGFLSAQREWYTTWSGRYTTSALVSVGTLHTIDGAYGSAAVLAIVATLAAFFALVSGVIGRRQPLSVRVAVSMAGTVLFLAGLPDIAQTIYWATGSLAYQSGNVALLLLVAVLARVERRGRLAWPVSLLVVALAGALAVFAVGTNEATLICTVAVLASGAVVAGRYGRKSRFVWAALVGIAVAASVLSLAAPGNRARAATLASDPLLRPPWGLAAILYIPWVVLRLGYWLSNVAIWASAFLVVAGTWDEARLHLCPGGRFDRRWLAVPAGWLALLFLVNGLGFAVNHYPLPERAESVTYLVFLLGWYPTSVILYHALAGCSEVRPSPRLSAIAAMLLVVGLAGAPNVFEAFKDAYRGYRYHREIAARVDLLRQARDEGRLDVEVPSLSRPPRTLFATTCASAWYGLRSLRLGAGNSR